MATKYASWMVSAEVARDPMRREAAWSLARILSDDRATAVTVSKFDLPPDSRDGEAVLVDYDVAGEGATPTEAEVFDLITRALA